MALLVAIVISCKQQESCDIREWGKSVTAECWAHPDLQKLREGTTIIREAVNGNSAYHSADSLAKAMRIIHWADSVWPGEMDLQRHRFRLYDEVVAWHPTEGQLVSQFINKWENGDQAVLPYLATIGRSYIAEVREEMESLPSFALADSVTCFDFYGNLEQDLSGPIFFYERVDPFAEDLTEVRYARAQSIEKLAGCSEKARKLVRDYVASDAYAGYIWAGKMPEARRFAKLLGIDSLQQTQMMRDSRRVNPPEIF